MPGVGQSMARKWWNGHFPGSADSWHWRPNSTPDVPSETKARPGRDRFPCRQGRGRIVPCPRRYQQAQPAVHAPAGGQSRRAGGRRARVPSTRRGMWLFVEMVAARRLGEPGAFFDVEPGRCRPNAEHSEMCSPVQPEAKVILRQKAPWPGRAEDSAFVVFQNARRAWASRGSPGRRMLPVTFSETAMRRSERGGLDMDARVRFHRNAVAAEPGRKRPGGVAPCIWPDRRCRGRRRVPRHGWPLSAKSRASCVARSQVGRV